MTRKENVIGQVKNGQDWYEIEVEGRFNHRWLDWPDGGIITPLPGGNTLLSCWVRDQPALHGLFARIRDLNLKIISLRKDLAPQPDPPQRAKKQQ